MKRETAQKREIKKEIKPQVMHKAIVHHPLSDAQTVPEQG